MTATNRRLSINVQTKAAKVVYRNSGQNVAESFHSKTLLHLTFYSPTRARCRRLDLHISVLLQRCTPLQAVFFYNQNIISWNFFHIIIEKV